MKCFTNSKGISYYKYNGKYYKTTGWLNRPCSKEEYERELNTMMLEDIKTLKAIFGNITVVSDSDTFTL